MKVAILGGGVSGLALGLFLKRAQVECDIFEADAVAGGLCRSDIGDGYVMDRAGGHIMYTKSDAIRRLWAELFPEGLVKSVRETRILYHDRYVQYPFENGLGDLPVQDNFVCLKGLIESHFRREQGAVKPDNFHDWIDYRMGAGIAEKFMRPYNEKIWKIDLHELGITWVDGRVPDAPLDDALKASLGIKTVGYAHQATFEYPRAGGFQAITDRLATRVRERLHLAMPVTDITRRGDRLAINGTPYDRVVSTIPMNTVARLFEGLDQETVQAAAHLQYRGVASFLFGIPRDQVQPYSWVYLPFAHQGAANRVTYLSNYSPNNAPAGCGSVLAEATYRGDLEITTDYLDRLEQHLARCGLFRQGSVRVRGFAKNAFGYIIYDHGFDARRQRAIAGLERAGVLTLGRFGQYNYHNHDHCISDAMVLAERLAAEARGACATRSDG
ncbi:MAG: FAD-dependent oxidoreductase [Planctomycetota bacterium]